MVVEMSAILQCFRQRPFVFTSLQLQNGMGKGQNCIATKTLLMRT